jgi:hypothetical protein
VKGEGGEFRPQNPEEKKEKTAVKFTTNLERTNKGGRNANQRGIVSKV